MNWTVYCMGDLPIFRDIINAVAMVFNSSLFNPSLGAGLVLVAMLISLILFAFPAVMGKPLSPFPLIFVFMLYFGGVVPKTTLQIQDMYTGQVTTVDNVPIIVAAPAAISASIAKGITDTVETAFSTPSQGTSLSLGAEGFVNPLKELLVFRKLGTGGSVPVPATVGYQNANLKEFLRDCAVNAQGYSTQAMNNASDVMTYLTGLTVTGLTLQYSAAHPDGVIDSCTNAQQNISTTANALVTAGATPDLDKVANAQVPPANNSPGGVASMTAAYNSVTSQILGNAQTAQQFMVNMLSKNALQNGVRCVNASTPADVAACDSSFMIDSAVEGANIDAAGNASAFAKTAIPMMNILLALFYAFSPIIIGVALMSAAHGLKIIGGFLMFGAWTQSWMPIAAVLNYMVQEQMQYEVSKFGNGGITLANADAFYHAVSLKVGLASELLAMTPMLSMALLSGSMMALSSVAGKFSQDRVDETHAAPGLGKNGGLVDNGGGLIAGHDPIKMRSAHGDIAGNDVMQNDAGGQSMQISLADKAESAKQQAVSHMNSVARQSTHNLSKAADQAKEKLFTDSRGHTDTAALAKATSISDDIANKASEDFSRTEGMTETENAQLTADMKVGVMSALGGVSLDMNTGYAAARSHAHTAAARAAVEKAITASNSATTSFTKQFSQSRSTANATKFNRTMSEAYATQDSAMQSATAQAQQAESQATALSGSQTLGADQLAANVFDNGGFSSATFDSAVANSGVDHDKYTALKHQFEENIRNKFGKNHTLTGQQRIEAGISALSKMGDGQAFMNVMSKTGAMVSGGAVGGTTSAQTAQIQGDAEGRVGAVGRETAGASAGAHRVNPGGSSGEHWHDTGKVDKDGQKIYESDAATYLNVVNSNLNDRPPATVDPQQMLNARTEHNEHVNKSREGAVDVSPVFSSTRL